MKKICAEKDAEFIDIYELFSSLGHKQFLEDGLHPNTEGHRLIFKKVKGFLEKKKII